MKVRLIRRELSDDVVEATESTAGEVVELLQRFSAGEYWESTFYNDADSVNKMNRYAERLRESGLSVGRGDAQWGYKMPLPEEGSPYRYLQIFRRSR